MKNSIITHVVLMKGCLVLRTKMKWDLVDRYLRLEFLFLLICGLIFSFFSFLQHFFVLCFHYRTVEVPSSRIVIIEGIYALSERLRPLLDLRVSVRGGVHFDLVKRVLRDIQRAGQEPEEIIHQISETVCSLLLSILLWYFQSYQVNLFSAGVSNVQGFYRTRSRNCTYKNHQQV